MSTLGRITLLGLFGGCGLAIAIYLAVSTDPHKTDRLDLPRPEVFNTPVEPAGGPTAISTESSDSERPTTAQNDVPIAEPTRPTADRESLGPPPQVAVRPSVAQPDLPITNQIPPRASEPSVPVSAFVDMLKLLQPKERAESVRLQQAEVETLPKPAPSREPLPAKPETASSVNVVNDADDTITVHFNGTEIREVLKILSQGSGQNILATPSVQGNVTASLHNVDFETALNSILRSAGFVSVQEGNIIFVGTPEELQVADGVPIGTRIYRPNYISAQEFQQLITSLLTPEVGTISISTAPEVGLPSDAVNAGGDSFANADVVLVRDFEPVLHQIDQIYEDVDTRPLQVAIEAMILSVRLDDTNRLGVNFELLRDRNDVRIISGVPPTTLANIDVSSGGLKVGFLNGNTTVFVEALETIGDTNVIATPRLLALDKQRAEILIGSQLGYVNTTQTETAATQSVEFLEVGTQLRIRPFISSDGSIRMELHPELSTGNVRVEGGFTLPDKDLTTVTTNVIAKDGSTVIIGGLIREEIDHNATQIPLFGSLPGVGFLFRQKTDKIERREILVLITPRILYDSELDAEGNHGAMEFHHRQAVRFENTTPLSQQRISESYIIKAQHAWAGGYRQKALQYVNQAIHYDPTSRAAIDLRADIWEGNPVGDHALGAPYEMPEGPPNPLEGPGIDPWLLDRLDPNGRPHGPQLHPREPGIPGPRERLQTPPLRPQHPPNNSNS